MIVYRTGNRLRHTRSNHVVGKIDIKSFFMISFHMAFILTTVMIIILLVPQPKAMQAHLTIKIETGDPEFL